MPTHPWWSTHWPWYCLLLVVAFVLVVGNPAHVIRGGGGSSATVTANYTGPTGAGRTAFAKAVLSGAGLPDTPSNVAAMDVWEAAEGGGFGNQAANNPLNLNPGSASWPGHAVNGAWAFPTERDGIDETITYLHYSNYTSIYAAFKAGNSEHAVLQAIVDSPWAGSHYAGNGEMQNALAQTAAAFSGSRRTWYALAA